MSSYDILKPAEIELVTAKAKQVPSGKWICEVCPEDTQVEQSSSYLVARDVARNHLCNRCNRADIPNLTQHVHRMKPADTVDKFGNTDGSHSDSPTNKQVLLLENLMAVMFKKRI